MAYKNVKINNESREFKGPGKGEDDKIPVDLPEGSYIIDAHSVAFLGDGSTKAGVEVLKKFEHQVIRKFGGELDEREGSESKSIPSLLSDGEYQISPLVTTLLGHGDNIRGAKALAIMVRNLRRHKISKGIGLPPKAHDIWQYLPPSVRKWKDS